MLAAVMPWIGHAATRARGTIGGSLAAADPAAEISLVAVMLGATLIYRDGGKTPEGAATGLFLGPLTTPPPPARRRLPVRFPVWPEGRTGMGFHEVNARKSDFAFVSAAAQIALNEDGTCRRLAAAVGAATVVPLRLDSVATALEGRRIDEQATRSAVT